MNAPDHRYSEGGNMRVKLLWALGCFILCVTAVLAIAFVQGKPEPKPVVRDEARPESPFYTGANEKPVYSSSIIRTPVSQYRFEPVLQGDRVVHDFLIRNTWDIPMEFGRVKSCCGVILTDHTPVILPGDEGKISVTILTDKYGGQTIKGTLEADVLDSRLPDISVDISLDVTSFAAVSQHKIILKGSIHQMLEGEARITPEDAYPFNVTGIKAKKGLHIEYGYRISDQDGKKILLVQVRNKKKTPGVYRDMLFILTDNPQRPEIRIRVEGHISE